MARKAQRIQESQDASSDDDAPEVVDRSTSKADAKRSQKALHDAQVAEKARKKTRNQERDVKLKERARLTKGENAKKVRFATRASDGEDEGEDEGDGNGNDDVKARMLRAMKEARDEMEDDDADSSSEDGEFKGFGQSADSGDQMTSASDMSFAQDDDDDADMSFEEGSSIDPEASSDDEDMDKDEEMMPARHVPRLGRKVDYLADDLFKAAFAAQNSKPVPKKEPVAIEQQSAKKRRRKSVGRPKDLVIGGRTIRTLSNPLDARSQAAARSVPSARANKFLEQSLAMSVRNEQAILKAKKKGWERRPANVGVMKYQGAPHGFARSVR